MDAGKKTVLILVYNDGPRDSRVMKEAVSLHQAGYQVHIYCRRMDTGQIELEEIQGIHVHRFPSYDAGVTKELSWFSELSFLIKTFAIIKNSLQAYGELFRKGRLHGPGKNILWRAAYKFWPLVPIKSQWFRELVILPIKNNELHHKFYADYGLYFGNLKKIGVNVRPDIIHCHDLFTLPAGIALSKEWGGAPVVYDAHELETERVPPLPPERKQFIRQLEEDCLPHLSGLVSVSPFILNYYQKRFKGPSQLVMNIPIESQNGNTQKGLREKLSLTPETPLVVYTGRVGGKYRGLHQVVKALSYLPDFQLALLGPRDSGYDSWLKGHIEKWNVSDRVHFLDPVAPGEVVSVISDADIAISPIQDVTLSYRHCLPNKLFEAIQANVPICASNLPQMAKVINDLGVGMLFDQTDASNIASTIDELYKRRKEFVVRDDKKALYEERYTWNAQSQSLLNLYSDLVSS